MQYVCGMEWNMTVEWNETIKWNMTMEWNETTDYELQKWNMNVVFIITYCRK